LWEPDSSRGDGHHRNLSEFDGQNEKVRNRRYSDEQQKISPVQAEGPIQQLANGKRPQIESAH
jgi:hypothetical protein